MKKSIAVLLFAVGSLGANAANAAGAMGPWYAFGTLNASFGGPTYDYARGENTDVDITGASVTLGAGRAMTYSNNMVLGFELDVTAGDIDSKHIEGNTTPCLFGEGGCKAEVDWMSSLRVLAGMKFNKTTPFLTAGLVVGQISGYADFGACDAPKCEFDETQTGWTVGIGMQHEFTDKLSLRAEWDYIDLGSPDFTTNGVTTDFNFSQARIGVSYKF